MEHGSGAAFCRYNINPRHLCAGLKFQKRDKCKDRLPVVNETLHEQNESGVLEWIGRNRALFSACLFRRNASASEISILFIRGSALEVFICVVFGALLSSHLALLAFPSHCTALPTYKQTATAISLPPSLIPSLSLFFVTRFVSSGLSSPPPSK